MTKTATTRKARLARPIAILLLALVLLVSAFPLLACTGSVHADDGKLTEGNIEGKITPEPIDTVYPGSYEEYLENHPNALDDQLYRMNFADEIKYTGIYFTIGAPTASTTDSELIAEFNDMLQNMRFTRIQNDLFMS